MKFGIKTMMLIFCGFIIISAQETDRINIAVIDLESRGGLSQSEIGVLTDRLRSQLVQTNSFNVVDRGLMQDILKEQGFQMTGCTSTDCAVQAGKILGVQQMVAGTIGRIGNLYTVDISLIDVQTSKIMKSLTRDYSGEVEGLVGIMKSIAEELAGIQTHKPAETAKGVLDIKSNPDKAQIYVDNAYKGQTPLKIADLAAGEHVLKIVKAGYNTVEGKFSIEAKKTKEYNADLKKIYNIKISSRPSDAVIYIDNRQIGVTPYTYQVVEDSKIAIVIKKENFKSYEKSMVIKKDEALNVELEFAGAIAKKDEQVKEGDKSGGKTWLWIGAGAAAAGAAIFFLLPKDSKDDEPVVTTSEYPLPPVRP
ncbi:MAG: PEGA domain-containing protein [Calditrichaceae bacterium]|nr:PEGA domain-containing protein [Calditrichaceae bacterium]MBN2708745.1 PEGA domain-containing protein [Calditrichaceae bacterium]